MRSKKDTDAEEYMFLPLLIVIILNQSLPIHPHIAPPHLPSFPLVTSPIWNQEEGE